MIATRRSRSAIEQLRAVTLFKALSDKELEKVDRLGCRSDVDAGTVLCRQGGVGRQTFVVLDGEASVTIDGEEVADIGPGGFFGEMSILDGGPRVGTVTAVTPMTVLVFAPQEFGELLQNARIARRMLTAVSGRLRQVER